MRAIGLMSGTSMDGIDVALVETDGRERVTPGPSGFFPYGDDDRALLRRALADAVTLDDRAARPGALAQAERLVTDRHAAAVERFLEAHDLAAETIDVVGFHGQTVLHRPRVGLTIQIGDGAGLAARLGIPVVSDLRAADIAAGGEGAPLVPVFHRALVAAAGLARPVALLNVGGVANITVVGVGDALVACDTGPGNALLDDLMLSRTGVPIDRDGAAARAGTPHEDALSRLMDDPYFSRPLPKSLDRNHFLSRAVEGLSTPDAAATLVAFTAEAVAATLRACPEQPARVIVCGGGAANPALMRALAQRLPCPVETAAVHGWSIEAMEAQAFAYLAVRALGGLPLTYPRTTGVPTPTSGGVLARPRA